jgi:hypothetical protein
MSDGVKWEIPVVESACKSSTSKAGVGIDVIPLIKRFVRFRYSGLSLKYRLLRNLPDIYCPIRISVPQPTSNTCSSCGHIKSNLGTSEVYKCQTDQDG